MEQRDRTLLDAIDTVCMECSGVDDECHDCRLRKMASRIYKKENIYSMELAGFATVDNVEILIQKIQEAAQYIVDSISK